VLAAKAQPDLVANTPDATPAPPDVVGAKGDQKEESLGICAIALYDYQVSFTISSHSGLLSYFAYVAGRRRDGDHVRSWTSGDAHRADRPRMVARTGARQKHLRSFPGQLRGGRRREGGQKGFGEKVNRQARKMATSFSFEVLLTSIIHEHHTHH